MAEKSQFVATSILPNIGAFSADDIFNSTEVMAQ